MKKKDKRAIPKGTKGKIIISFLVAIVVTLITRIRETIPIIASSDKSFMLNPNVWITGAIFLFAFSFCMCLFYYNQYKDKIKISRYTIFLIISVVAGGLVSYIQWKDMAFWDAMLYFALCTGLCFAFFTIFSKINFEKISKNLFKFIQCLAYGVLFPSMFLIIALMGKIDKTGTFLISAKESLNKAAQIFRDTAYKLIEVTYNAGRMEYSGIFMVAIFVFLIFFALYNFFKKEKK